MGTVTKYGREFQFDDDVPADVQERRILNWMKENAADELKGDKGEPAIKEPGAKKTSYNPKLAAAMSVLSGPFGALGMIPAVNKRLGDVNFLRTLGQGALPVADEATAAVRSALPESWGGADYDTALKEERQGVQDYAREYGPMESGAVQMLGAAGTLPFGGAAVQAAMRTPRGASIARTAAAHPWISSALGGGATGLATGFASGEDDFTERAKNAGRFGLFGSLLGPAAYGATQGVKALTNLKGDNAVANYLRRRMSSEKKLAPDDPAFTDKANRMLRADMKERQDLFTDPMAADLMPATAEAVLQRTGKNTGELADAILARQYDKAAPPLTAKSMGQFGRVEDAFDLAWGKDFWKRDAADLLARKKADADAMFTPAYQQYIQHNPKVESALNSIEELAPGVLNKAKAFARAEVLNRTPGRLPMDRISQGELYYNTQYLHDIKRFLDEHVGEVSKGNMRFYDLPYVNAKKALNNAIKEQNATYKAAMERYGEHSALEDALRKGREEVFVPGSVDKTGAMDTDAIKKYLNDPDITPEAKDLFLSGAARALRQNVTANTSKKFSHNWADFINNPEYSDRMKALLDNKNITAWNLFHNKLTKESQNYKNLIQGGLGNSRTAARKELEKELEGPNLGAVANLGFQPTSPSALRQTGEFLVNKLQRGDMAANRVAEILGRKGKAGNRKSLAEIEALLRGFDKRKSFYDTAGAYAPYAATYGWPDRKD